VFATRQFLRANLLGVPRHIEVPSYRLVNDPMLSAELDAWDAASDEVTGRYPE
jgi:hypothetical protein